MLKENQFRQSWIEGWIGSRPDGVLHATVPETPAERPKSGPEPYTDADEREICLTCPLETCVLDRHKRCGRLAIFYKKRKEQKNDGGNEGGASR